MATIDRPGDLGVLLQRYRASAGLSQEELAERAGLSRRGISDLERGVHRSPYPSTVRQLADALQLPLAERARFMSAALPAESAASVESISVLARLPVVPTSFIGRERELRELTALLPTTRLLTLVGSGGVGKSRLAVQLARAQFDRYRGEVRLAELAALSDPALVPQTVAVVVGVHDQPGVPLIETVVAALRAQRLLLVLDNCEHLLGACAELVAMLLRGCPELCILATSRVVLDVSGETSWPVPALSLPDLDSSPSLETLTHSEAVQLFIERARAVAPGFALTQETSLAVADVCQRVDGLPLGIELAASWMRVLSADSLAARLADGFALSVRGARDAPERQRTLRATLDWSYRLLSEPEQHLLDCLSTFAGGATLEAIEAVCTAADETEPPALETLAGLLRASLVQRIEKPGAEPRYKLLETVREYATERLAEAGGAANARARHAAYYVELVQRPDHNLLGFNPRPALARIELELDNIRSALHSALERRDVRSGFILVWRLAVWTDRRGLPREFLDWGETFLALENSSSNSPSVVRAQALAATSYCAMFAGELDRAGALARAAETEFRSVEPSVGVPPVEDLDGIPFALHLQGSVALFSGQPAAAESLEREGVAVARRARAPRILSWTLMGLGLALKMQGRLTEAQAHFEKSVLLTRELGDLLNLPRVILALGALLCHQGDAKAASDLCREALGLAMEAADDTALQLAFDGLSRVASAMSQYPRAAHLLGIADARYDAMGVRWPRNIYAPPPSHTEFVAQMRDALGNQTFERLRSEGRACTLTIAVASALDDVPRPSNSC